jgi:hypothetical protein
MSLRLLYSFQTAGATRPGAPGRPPGGTPFLMQVAE